CLFVGSGSERQHAAFRNCKDLCRHHARPETTRPPAGRAWGSRGFGRKPSSVSPKGSDHLSRVTVAGHLEQPTRGSPARGPTCRCGSHLAAYLALLRLGVTVPPLLPGARWALTPPFH